MQANKTSHHHEAKVGNMQYMTIGKVHAYHWKGGMKIIITFYFLFLLLLLFAKRSIGVDKSLIGVSPKTTLKGVFLTPKETMGTQDQLFGLKEAFIGWVTLTYACNGARQMSKRLPICDSAHISSHLSSRYSSCIWPSHFYLLFEHILHAGPRYHNVEIPSFSFCITTHPQSFP